MRLRRLDAKDNGIVIEVVLIVAVAENGVIGAKGTIPWRVKADVQRLKSMTMRNISRTRFADDSRSTDTEKTRISPARGNSAWVRSCAAC